MGKQDIGDLDAIRKGIESWLRQKLSERDDLRIDTLDFPEASGESSVTLLLDARSQSAGLERFVLRMAPPESQVFDHHDLRMQFEMMQCMEREGVPAPPLVGYESDASLLGSDFYVMGFVDGRIPPDNPPFATTGWVKDELSDADRATMWDNALSTLADIHRIDPARHDFSRLPAPKPGEAAIAQEIRTFDAMWKPALREGADPELVRGWDFVRAHVPTPGTPGLCWGDARVGNLVFRDLAPVAVLDWEMANLSDPLSDLAWFVWIDRCNSEGLGVPRLGGLPEPAELYERWAARTGRRVDGIAWYELFAVTRYAIILERKFDAMRKAMPELGTIPNFAIQFVPALVEATR